MNFPISEGPREVEGGAHGSARAAAGTLGGTPWSLPERPLITLLPTRGWVPLNLRALWAYRELLYFLMWRDIKVRYKQTALGVAWAIIQPLVTALVFALVFGKFVGLPADGIPYFTFAYAGLLPWTFFANAVTNSGNSLVGSSNLITKVYFPRIIIPGAAVGEGLVDLAFASALLAGLMVYHGIGATWGLLMLPPLIGLITLLALAVGMWISALNVKYRDVRYALPFLIQVWMFATPIAYPASLVPERWRWAFGLNPLAGLIEGCRASLFGRELDWAALSISAAITVALLTYSTYSFRRTERAFADLI